jgi:hypothetical protein
MESKELAKEQAFLAKLYVDAEFRGQFFGAPKMQATAFGLRGAALDRALELDAEQVRQFARALLQKRWLAIPKLMPRTAKVMRARLREQFMAYAADHPVHGIHKHVTDALAFAQYLNTPEAPPELSYELGHLAALHSRAIWVFRWVYLRQPMEQGPSKRLVFWWRIGNGPLHEYWIH